MPPRKFISDVLAEMRRLIGLAACAVGWHPLNIAHPHYCGRCGRYVGLR